MFKGKYILTSVEELKEKVLNYITETNVRIISYNETHEENNKDILIQLENIDKINIHEVLKKIVGEEQHLIDDLTFDLKHNDYKYIVLNPTECSYMFTKIFDLDENNTFDEGVLYDNDGLDVYLFYI